MLEEIQIVFEAEPCIKGFSPIPKDFRLAEQVEKGHGRIERRTAPEAEVRRLLAITRGHWGIESGLHYRRDVTLREDRSRVRTGRPPQLLAAINNLVWGLFVRLGYPAHRKYVPTLRRTWTKRSAWFCRLYTDFASAVGFKIVTNTFLAHSVVW